jgi:hypothetical protein
MSSAAESTKDKRALPADANAAVVCDEARQIAANIAKPPLALWAWSKPHPSWSRRENQRNVGPRFCTSDASTRLVFDDVKTAPDLPFLNTDYRALARWPSYFALAWADLRPRLQRGEYETLVAEIHETAVSTVRSLPNYGNLRGEALRVTARSSASEGEVLSVVRSSSGSCPVSWQTSLSFVRNCDSRSLCGTPAITIANTNQIVSNRRQNPALMARRFLTKRAGPPIGGQAAHEG